MTYLTNDRYDQGVYFDLRKSEPRRRSGGTELCCYGLVGNGVSELPVTVRRWRDSVEVEFGGDGLFSFVEEGTVRRMLDELVRELPLH